MIRQPFFMRHYSYHLFTITLTIAILSSLTLSSSGQVRREEVVPNPVGQTDSQPSPSDTSSVKPDAKSSQPSKSKTDAKPQAVDQNSAESAKSKAGSSTNKDSKGDEKKPVMASAADPVSRDLQNIALQAQKQLSKDKLPKVATTKRELILALDNLERFLSTNPKQVESWKKFLRLDKMREEANAENPNPAILIARSNSR